MLKKTSAYLIGLLPMALVAGPFVAELFLFIIFNIFLFYVIKEKSFKIFDNQILKFFLVFCLYIVTLSFFSTEFFISFKSSFFYFRFGVYTLAIIYFLSLDDNFLNIIYNLLKITILFVTIDSIIQVFFGVDIFGLKTNNHDLMRVSGPFGDKFILGSFLQKILPVYIYLILKNFEKNKKLKITDIFILILSFVIIYRSGDRAAFGLVILFSFIFFMINRPLRKKMLIIALFSFILSALFTLQNPKIYKRYFVDTIGQFKGKYFEDFLQEDVNETNFNFMIFSFEHQTHYSTAFRMFLDKPIFGYGVKMFRFNCKEFEYKPGREILTSFGKYKETYGCSTHPHNTYFQLLSETGIVGFLTIFLLFLYLFYKILIYIRLKEQKIYPESALLAGIFINLWPVMPTGNFFNNWISIIYYLPVAYYIYEINSNSNLKIVKNIK